ncbi:Probable 2-oxoglutarate dehydrogenase E1 component DHKTD1-like protein, mitochondrial, partial [Camponotus floridanus]
VNKVILVSGKHYYALNNYREITGNKNVAIIRIESLSFIWSQEEPRNMGAWNFVKLRFETLCGRQVSYIAQK